jgi:uncharacterized protein
MHLTFTNRVDELAELNSAAKNGGLLVVFGRRRVGKTRLLVHWLKPRSGLYSQAIEPTILCLDEFPYLVAADPSLPSILQRWLDHQRPKNFLLILSGSSTRMMHQMFLNRSAPLYGRASKLLHIHPMTYWAFCSACRLNPTEMESFTQYSLVGGIPKYWEFVESCDSPIQLANELFFGFAPYLGEEPIRVLRDEGVSGANAVSLLEVIGRGANKPSEMAARLETAQTNLSRLLHQLLDASILTRQVPFGESLKSTRKTLYTIQDPTLRFWFRVYSPHRSRWHNYSRTEKLTLLRDHAASVFEEFCRQEHPGACRYWEKDLEFDFVRTEVDTTGREFIVASEVKWKKLSVRERTGLLKSLEEKWNRSSLSRHYKNVSFEVIDATKLAVK